MNQPIKTTIMKLTHDGCICKRVHFMLDMRLDCCNVENGIKRQPIHEGGGNGREEESGEEESRKEESKKGSEEAGEESPVCRENDGRKTV